MWMVVPAPVILLMIEMGLVPPSTAVADDRGVSEIVLAFTASVITAPPRPAFRPAHTARMTLPGSSTRVRHGKSAEIIDTSVLLPHGGAS
ncbi:MAG TPA: hypothetical protein VHW24_14290 [Bryobacteraceae bacterium]|nr:hypothetical protein [Bryobacteraceae bacterium]